MNKLDKFLIQAQQPGNASLQLASKIIVKLAEALNKIIYIGATQQGNTRECDIAYDAMVEVEKKMEKK